eukprot:5298039-Pleurochrysis_carterae.AAC.1
MAASQITRASDALQADGLAESAWLVEGVELTQHAQSASSSAHLGKFGTSRSACCTSTFLINHPIYAEHLFKCGYGPMHDHRIRPVVLRLEPIYSSISY